MCTKIKVSISFHEILELITKFSKFMLALLKGRKQKLTQEQVNMIEKEEMAKPQEFPPKMKLPKSSPSLAPLVGWKPHMLYMT